DSSVALDLTFLRRTRSNTGRNVKSATLVDSSWPGGCRPGRWQRHGMGRGLLVGVTNVPLAHAMAAGAFGAIHMHVILVIAVGAGAEHGGEAPAGGLAQAEAIILRHLRIGQLHRGAIGKLEGAHVERVALAVLRELRADHPVTAAAIIGVIVVE